MKTRMIMTVAPVTVVGGIILLLGCGAESQKTAINQAPVVITTKAPPQTNDTALAEAPVAAIETAPAKLSPGLDEIVQLAQAGVGDDVLVAYVENSPNRYKLAVDEILYLHDLGISAEVIAAMVRHGESSPEPATPVAATPPPQPGTPAEDVNTNPPPSVAQAEPSNANAYAVTPPTVEQVNYNYFYQTLAPYGGWVEVPAYGWCWRPTVAVVDVNWQPYCDRGRWLWTDCGWYWQSDYAWGWAPFHYGRWHRSAAYGWVWWPDTAWAPAWVTWRYSNAYCGWAPLPPGARFEVGLGFRFHGGRVGVGFDFGLDSACFTFVPTSRFCDRTPWHHRLPPTQVVNVFNRTTIINNYAAGSNNRTVVNLGPGQNAIAAVSRTEIRKVNLRDANANRGSLIRADRLDNGGSTLTVFRPQLPKQASAPPPEITRRQQERREKTETLVNSESVRLARVDAERRTPIAPVTRGSAQTASERRAPWAAPTDSATGNPGRAVEARRAINTPVPNTAESITRDPAQPAISRNPRSELRNAGQSSPALARPSRLERDQQAGVESAPSTLPQRRIESDGRSAGVQPQQRPQTQANPRSGSIAEQQPQFGYQVPQAPAANPPAFRQEGRRREAIAPSFPTSPADTRPSAQSITPPPGAIQPREVERRFSAPEYRPPQNSFSPPAGTAPRAIEPAFRPSSPPSYSQPSVSHPVPSSPPPAVSRPQPAPSPPPSAARPSSPPSQSRGESRQR